MNNEELGNEEEKNAPHYEPTSTPRCPDSPCFVSAETTTATAQRCARSSVFPVARHGKGRWTSRRQWTALVVLSNSPSRRIVRAWWDVNIKVLEAING